MKLQPALIFIRIILFTAFSGFLQLFCEAQQISVVNPYILPNEMNFRKTQEFNEVIDFAQINYKKINAVIFYLTNEIRVNHQLKPLGFSPELECSAMMHADDMANGGFFNHINSGDKNKQTPNDRARLCNVKNPMLAENIIEGFGLKYKANSKAYIRGKGNFSTTPDGDLIPPHTYLSLGESLLDSWMKSADHLANILSSDALQLGCGTSYFENYGFNDMPTFYAVQNFQLYHAVIPNR